jgi:zinc protease
MNPRLPAAVLAAAAAVTSVAVAQDYTHPRDMNLADARPLIPDPSNYQYRLANGLVIYIIEDHTAPLVTFTALVRAGTAQGRRGAGAAVEQALRSGPANTSPAAFRQTLEEMTAAYAVSVGREITELSLNVPAEDAWQALDLLAAVLRAPRVGAPGASPQASPGAVRQAEDGPVLYEGSMPVAVRLFEDLLYGAHPFGGSVADTDTATLTPSDVSAFHQQLFVPSNVVLAVAGDLDGADVRRRVLQTFGDWRARSAPRVAAPPSLAGGAPERTVHTFEVDKLQGWVVMGHELPAVPLADEAPLQVMNYILAGDHLAGRMFIEARDRRGLANDEIGHPEPRLRGPGTYTFRAAGRPASIAPLIDVALKEIERIQNGTVTEEELLVAKGALADGAFVLQFRNGHSTAATLAREWAEFGDHRRSATYRARIQAVSAAQVRAAARKYLHPDRMQIVVLGPVAAIRESSQPGLETFGRVQPGTARRP